tara:strand:+ start:44 stop:1114 length:1071 start_codon:yes stop_codon:yes gene_type:complete
LSNSIKSKNSKEVRNQLKRAEVQKNILIKKIYKEYEIYFKIVRKSLLTCVKKGIFTLSSDLYISDKVLNSNEFNNFLNINISSLIHSKLPLITIEQLKLGNISDPKKKLVKVNDLKEIEEFKEYQAFNFGYDNELIAEESVEFHCNNNSNTYEYYDSLSEDDISSVNLDECSCLSSYPKENSIKKNVYENHVDDSVLELIEETNHNILNEYKNNNYQESHVILSNNNLNSLDIIDKSFGDFLLNLSYKINLELFKINLIKKYISEDTLKCFSNNNYITKHPYPFVIKYDLNLNKFADNNKCSDIYLFNMTIIELEFYNLDLSICRNNINEIKNRLKLLNKKQGYWKHMELSLNNLI